MSEMIEPEVVESEKPSVAAALKGGMLRGAKNMLILRGILFLILGVLMLVNPVATITIAIMVLGFYMLSEGVFMLMAARRSGSGSQPLNGAGIFLLVLGCIAVISPWLLGEVAILVLGIWQLVSGIQCLFFPTEKNRGTVFSGILSLITGVLFLVAPIWGLAALGFLIAVPFFLAGAAMLGGGLSLGRN